MKTQELLKLIKGKNITDMHFRAGIAPLLRKDGRLIKAGSLKALSAPQIKRLAFSWISW